MRLHYKHYGEGHPFIIAHGLYGSSDNWVSVAKKLMPYFKVWLLDLRNHGESPHSPDMSYGAMAGDIFDFFRENIRGKATILGHSMGGKVMLRFAVDHPEMVSNLIIADIAPKSYNDAKFRRQMSVNHEEIISSMKEIPLETLNSRHEIENELSKYIKNNQLRKFLLKNISKSGDKYLWKINLDALLNNLDLIFDTGISVDSYKNKPIAHFPVLFIKGENSQYISEDDSGTIHRIFSYAKIINIPEDGHWLHAEQPEVFIEAILDFVF